MYLSAILTLAGLVTAQDANETSSPNGSEGHAPEAGGAGTASSETTNVGRVGWRSLDEVVLIVDEDVISKGEFMYLIELERRRTALNTRRQVNELFERLTVDQADRILATQAGRDLGIDPEQVELRVQQSIHEMVDQFGVTELSRQLRGRGYDSKRWRDQRADELYRQHWEALKMGKLPNQNGRFIQDRYVRPGYLRYMFDRLIGDDEILLELGGRPEEVVVQNVLIGASKDDGGVEGARRKAAAIRLECMAGKDFAEFVEPGTENQGIVDAKPTSKYRVFPGIHDFLMRAEVGDVSKPISVENEGRIVAWRVVKLLERRERTTPDFESPEVQKRVEELTLRDMDQMRLHLALNELYESAYVWPDTVRKSRPPIAPRVTRTDEEQ